AICNRTNEGGAEKSKAGNVQSYFPKGGLVLVVSWTINEIIINNRTHGIVVTVHLRCQRHNLDVHSVSVIIVPQVLTGRFTVVNGWGAQPGTMDSPNGACPVEVGHERPFAAKGSHGCPYRCAERSLDWGAALGNMAQEEGSTGLAMRTTKSSQRKSVSVLSELLQRGLQRVAEALRDLGHRGLKGVQILVRRMRLPQSGAGITFTVSLEKRNMMDGTPPAVVPISLTRPRSQAPDVCHTLTHQAQSRLIMER
ncbi:hypothetical protein THAOC_04152, partial [Thalassiosira oceanica]